VGAGGGPWWRPSARGKALRTPTPGRHAVLRGEPGGPRLGLRAARGPGPGGGGGGSRGGGAPPGRGPGTPGRFPVALCPGDPVPPRPGAGVPGVPAAHAAAGRLRPGGPAVGGRPARVPGGRSFGGCGGSRTSPCWRTTSPARPRPRPAGSPSSTRRPWLRTPRLPWPWGRWFDRRGMAVLALGTAASAAFAPLSVYGGPGGAVAGALLWGVGVGLQESVLRAAVARMVPPDRRASAFGLLQAVYGVAWFRGQRPAGSALRRAPRQGSSSSRWGVNSREPFFSPWLPGGGEEPVLRGQERVVDARPLRPQNEGEGDGVRLNRLGGEADGSYPHRG
jgi:hypothetical protein